jgi:hypothetical protein
MTATTHSTVSKTALPEVSVSFFEALAQLPSMIALEGFIWDLPNDVAQAIYADAEARWEPYLKKFGSPQIGRLVSDDEDDRLRDFDDRKYQAFWDRRAKMTLAQILREGYEPGDFAYQVGQGYLTVEAAVAVLIEEGAPRERAQAEAEAMFDWRNLLADVLFGEEVDFAHQKQLERKAAARRLNKNPGPTGWGPVNWMPYLRGQQVEQSPTRLARVDGLCLLYPKKLHWISGEPEGLKSWLAQVAVADALKAGRNAIYIDFEGDAAPIFERMLALGVSAQQIQKQLSYHRPERAISDEAVEAVLDEAEEVRPAIAVIDGVRAAMGASGLDSNVGRDFIQWLTKLGRPLQRVTDGPTLAIDHVVKDPDKRGAYAAGAGEKQAVVDVHLGLEVVESFGRGMTGRARIIVHKDRAGFLNPHATGKPGHKLIGVLVMESAPDTGQVTSRIEVPSDTDLRTAQPSEFRPTALMERVSRWMESPAVMTGPAPTKRKIRDNVVGKAQYVDRAIDCLVEEGHLTVDTEPRYPTYRLGKPFRETDLKRPGS